jgi:hypothetical protein
MFSNYGLDPLEAQRRTNLATKRSRQATRDKDAWKEHAHGLGNENLSLTQKLAYSEALVERYRYLAAFDGQRLLEATQGITVSGYTNNPAHELEICIAEQLNITDLITDPHEYTNARADIIKTLTPEQKKTINLKLLCRMEWIDWCLHADVLAKFGAEVTDAFINPTETNKLLRNKKMLSFYTKASKEYHALRELAMDPVTGEGVRAEFEDKRFNFWKDKIQYKYWDDGVICPNTDLTLAKHPDISLDSHLIAGQIAELFEINIHTLKKDICFRATLAQCIPHGLATNVKRGTSASVFYI